jgi:hypothetical protein
MAGIRSLINNFSTTLGENISNVDTTFDLTSTTGLSAKLALCDFVPMTIDDGVNIEIIHVTSVSTLTITCVRGREGTSGTAFSSGAVIECRATDQSINQASEWIPVDVMTLGSDTTNIDFVLTETGDYKVAFCGVTIATDAQDIQFQQGTGGGPTYQNTNYYASGNWRSYTSSANNVATNNGSEMTLLTSASNSALNTIEGEFIITDPSNSGIRHNAKWRFSQQSKDQEGSGIRDTTEAITALRFKTASGDFKTGSRFILYRRAN